MNKEEIYRQTIEDWKINIFTRVSGKKAWYIYGYVDWDINFCRYIHRNGSVHYSCGDPGFFDSYEQATSALPFKKIPDELFDI